jgi:hypothetical protein
MNRIKPLFALLLCCITSIGFTQKCIKYYITEPNIQPKCEKRFVMRITFPDGTIKEVSSKYGNFEESLCGSNLLFNGQFAFGSINVSGYLTEANKSTFGHFDTPFFCPIDSTNKNWRYFNIYSDTIKIENRLIGLTKETHIAKIIHPLVIGKGANLREEDALGGYVKFATSDNYIVEFSFSLRPDYYSKPICSKCDYKPPVFTRCPQNIEKTLTPHNTCMPVTWQEPIATDETSTPSVSGNYKSGFCFPLGITRVIYTAEDASGNTSICSFNATIKQATDIKDCVIYSIKDFKDSAFCTEDKNSSHIIKMTYKKYSSVYRWKSDSSRLSISPCGIKLSLETKSGFNPSGPEDISMSGDLTETSRSSSLLSTSLSTRSLCQYNKQGKNWRIFDLEFGLSSRYTGILAVLDSFTIGIGANLRDLDKMGAYGRFIIGKDNGGIAPDGTPVIDTIELELSFLLDTIGKPTCDRCDTKPPVFTSCPQNIEKISTSDKACVVVTWQEPTVTDDSGITPSVSSNFKSGFCFPVGTTKVDYTAKDITKNTATCTFNVVVKPKPIVQCVQYTVDNTNQRCTPQTWKPFSMIIGGTLYKADRVVLKQYSDNTAQLSGIFRDARWHPILVTLNLKDYVKTPTRQQITIGNCLNNNTLNTQDWYMYKTWSGTIQFENTAPTPISGQIPFQFGKGANLQNLNDLGGSTAFLYKGQVGVFAFKLLNPAPCATGQSLSTAFEIDGRIEPDKIKLTWVENRATTQDVFDIEKLLKGQYALINTVKPMTQEGLRHYTTYDTQPEDGLNSYRITLRKGDGSSENQTIELHFVKSTYAEVFPNPVLDDMQVILLEKPKDKVTLHLYNATGYEVKTVIGDGNTTYSIQTNDLPAGLYMLRIAQSGKRDYMKQVIISH